MNLIYKLVGAGRVVDAFILARFTYRMGEELISDVDYEKIREHIKLHNLAPEYVNRTQDDDPIPYDLLQEFNLTGLVAQLNKEREELFHYLDEQKSLSIEAVTEYSEAYKYFMSFWEQDLIAGIKMNGINIKNLLQYSEHKLSMSRGRSGTGFDLTDNVQKVVPKRTKGLEHLPEVKVVAESFVFRKDLKYLQNKYDPSIYKLERSAATSMLRVPHEPQDYNLLKIVAFYAEGIAPTISESLQILQEGGWDVVPHIVIKAKSAPQDYDKFCVWLKSLLDEMYELGGSIPSDGVIIDVDDINFEATVKHQYSNRNIALKMEYWSYVYYIGEVTAITEEQKRVYRNCKVKIKPMVTNDSAEAKTINVFNPSILIKEGIREGSRIPFERNSEAVNILLRGKRLENIGEFVSGSEDNES